MKKSFILMCILYLCVFFPLSSQLKVNRYGAVYAGAYGTNPDATTPAFDIPGLYLYGSSDYPAMVCKVGSAGYGIEIDGRSSQSGNLFRIIGGDSYGLIYASGNNGHYFSVNCNAYVSGNVFTGNNFVTRIPTKSASKSEGFKKIDSPLNKLMKLNGILYQAPASDIDTNKKSTSAVASPQYRIGLRAEEVKEVVPEVIYTLKDGETGIAYNELVGLLIEAVKEQQATIEEQQSVIAKMQSDIDEMKSPSAIESVAGDKMMLLQNIPNPFNSETRIGYYLPETVGNARLLVYDLQGSQLKNIPVSERGKGEVIIQAYELNAGMYIYTLLADGKEVDTKRMILTK